LLRWVLSTLLASWLKLKGPETFLCSLKLGQSGPTPLKKGNRAVIPAHDVSFIAHALRATVPGLEFLSRKDFVSFQITRPRDSTHTVIVCRARAVQPTPWLLLLISVSLSPRALSPSPPSLPPSLSLSLNLTHSFSRDLCLSVPLPRPLVSLAAACRAPRESRNALSSVPRMSYVPDIYGTYTCHMSHIYRTYIPLMSH